MRVLSCCLLASLTVGCAARPLTVDASGSDGATDEEETSTADPGPGTPTGPGTTTDDPPTPDPDPEPTGPEPRLDLGEPEPQPGIPVDACATGWGPGTWVEGVTPSGAFFGNRSWLGMALPFEPGWLRVVILGTNADVAKNLEEAEQGGFPATGPAVVLETEWPFGDWIGQGEVPAVIIQDGQPTWIDVRLSVDQMLGNWDEWDPDDPPRIRGVVGFAEGESFGFDGQFDAAYCGAFHKGV